MKVTYTALQGFTSKAYLDDEPVAENIYDGTNKHTDEDIRVFYDKEIDKWIEIKKEMR